MGCRTYLNQFYDIWVWLKMMDTQKKMSVEEGNMIMNRQILGHQV